MPLKVCNVSCMYAFMHIQVIFDTPQLIVQIECDIMHAFIYMHSGHYIASNNYLLHVLIIMLVGTLSYHTQIVLRLRLG